MQRSETTKIALYECNYEFVVSENCPSNLKKSNSAGTWSGQPPSEKKIGRVKKIASYICVTLLWCHKHIQSTIIVHLVRNITLQVSLELETISSEGPSQCSTSAIDFSENEWCVIIVEPLLTPTKLGNSRFHILFHISIQDFILVVVTSMRTCMKTIMKFLSTCHNIIMNIPPRSQTVNFITTLKTPRWDWNSNSRL